MAKTVCSTIKFPAIVSTRSQHTMRLVLRAQGAHSVAILSASFQRGRSLPTHPVHKHYVHLQRRHVPTHVATKYAMLPGYKYSCSATAQT